MPREIVTICDHTFLVPSIPTPIVLDLGANAGVFAKTVIERFSAQVYGVEPNPYLHDALREIPFRGVLFSAASSISGVAEFRIAANSEESSLKVTSPSASSNSITVPTMTLAEIMQRFELGRIDILKMDIEGAEIDVLGSTPEVILAKQIGQISIEFHTFSGLVERGTVLSAINKLRKLGLWVIDFSVSHFDVLVLNPDLLRLSSFDYLRLTHFERWKRMIRKRMRA